MNRREFIRRMVIAYGLVATGVLSTWELLQNYQKNAAPSSVPPPNTLSLPPPSTTTAADSTVTALQTVTVTEYASGSTTQQQSASSQTSSQTTSQATSTTQPVPAGYILLAPLSALNGKTSSYFNHPTRGLSLLLYTGGQWRAFSATCTHAPCTVQYDGSQISCPCHGGTYNPANGAVTGGPPPAPLPELGILVQNNNIYVSA